MTVFRRSGQLAAVLSLLFAISPAGLAAKQKYQEVEVTDGGSISGRITFSGELPVDAIDRITINKNPDVCDEDGTGYREVVWVGVKDGALRGTFVFIDKISSGKKWQAPPGGNYLVLQEGCRFLPWAQVVQPGEITIRHADPDSVLHNINTREMIGIEKGRVVKRTMFNFGQPDPGDIVKKLKPRRSPFISLNCEAHNFMFGFMMAPGHPYAVVVGDDGSYLIDNVPPGDYTVKAWHPRFGIQKSKLNVPAGDTATADFNFSHSE